MRPFRTGLVILGLGVMTILGEARGGSTGEALDLIFGRLLGDTGTAVLGFFLVVTGALLVSGASLGALVRHSARAAQKTAVAARRSVERVRIPLEDEPITQPDAPPVDGASAYPDVVGENPEPSAVLVDQLDDLESQLPERPAPVFDMPSTEHAGYKLPDAGVLKRSRTDSKKGQPEKAIERTAEALLQALSNFGVEAHLIGQVVGPRVTRYELQLAPGTKVGKVASLKDDLAYALATTELRILAPIPGKQAVGVEVPNLSPNVVTLGDIFADMPSGSSPLSVWLGKDISGSSVPADLARMPHILIAGTTGSGKSGCINTMLCSILLRATPDEVRMILVDPKRVELGLYESIPHLLTPVVSSPKAAAAVLTNVLTEMEHRYERMSLARARNLPELNRVLGERGEQTLPYLLVVIDELADLMMVSPQDVEDAVIRLAQKSRAVGIHLVLATQRPSVDVITGMIKANVPSRIAFAVSSMTDSRVILDTCGRREPSRPGRHALQAARHVAAPARPGRLRERGGDRPHRRAVPRTTGTAARRVAPRGAERARARGGGRRVRPGRGSPPRPRDRDRRPDPDRLRFAHPAAPARRLHAGRPSHRHARAPRDHLGLRGLQAAPRAHRRRRPRTRPYERSQLTKPPAVRPSFQAAGGIASSGSNR